MNDDPLKVSLDHFNSSLVFRIQEFLLHGNLVEIEGRVGMVFGAVALSCVEISSDDVGVLFITPANRRVFGRRLRSGDLLLEEIDPPAAQS